MSSPGLRNQTLTAQCRTRRSGLLSFFWSRRVSTMATRH